MINSASELKGKPITYKGERDTIEDAFVVDGQVILKTHYHTIKINKSELRKELKALGISNGVEPTNGASRVNNVLGEPNEIDPIETDDPAADYYYSTRNYDQFVFHEKNRSINQAHVSNLVKSIKKNDLLFAQPILVNSDFEVIDGQHRLCAAMELNKRIFYIIKPGLTIEDAISLNINTRNWGYADYLDHWIAQEKENYIYFKKFRDGYNFSYTLAISLLHFGRTGSRDCKKIFENGNLGLNHKTYAEFIGRIVSLCSRHGKFTTDRSFIRAVDQSIRTERLDPFLFLQKLEMCPDKFTKCSDTDSYLRMMEDVINYHHKGERIRLY